MTPRRQDTPPKTLAAIQSFVDRGRAAQRAVDAAIAKNVAHAAGQILLVHVGEYLDAVGWREHVAGTIKAEQHGDAWRIVVDLGATPPPGLERLDHTSQTSAAPRRRTPRRRS